MASNILIICYSSSKENYFYLDLVIVQERLTLIEEKNLSREAVYSLP